MCHLSPLSQVEALPESSRPTAEPLSPRRVQAVVALRLLEVLRDQDLPVEILEDEDPTQTMPRRFGLSDVVERQIRTYREDSRKGVRLPDGEVRDLFRFVIRRPDGEVVFTQVGRLLAARTSTRWTRLLPLRARFAVARVRAKRRLRQLFGRQTGGFGRGPFALEGRSLFFVESDPGGAACHLISGFCEEILEYTAGGKATVTHSLCQSRGDALCRWEASLEPTVIGPEPPSDPDEVEP